MFEHVYVQSQRGWGGGGGVSGLDDDVVCGCAAIILFYLFLGSLVHAN